MHFVGVWYLSRQDILVRWCLFIIFPPFYSIILLPVLTMVNEEVIAFFCVSWCLRGGGRSLRGSRGLTPNEPVLEKFPLALILPGINLWIKCREQRGWKGHADTQPCVSIQGRGAGGSAGSRRRDSPSQENQGEEEKHFPKTGTGRIYWIEWFWSLFGYFG